MDLTTLVASLVDAYNRHDPSAIEACYHPEATHVDVAAGRPKVGREAIRDGLAHFLRSFPDARWEVTSVVSGEIEAAVRYRLTGTLLSDLGPFRAQGQQLELDGVLWVEAAGLITRCSDYWDAASLSKQLQNPEPVTGKPTEGAPTS